MKRLALALIFFCLLSTRDVLAVMNSGNYQIPWDSINTGGNDSGASVSYKIHDTLGGVAVGTSVSASYQLSADYRAGDSSNALSLVIQTQDPSTSTMYSGLNVAAGSVNVSSTSGLAVNGYVAVVEHVGAAQKAVVGKIASVSGSMITVDHFDGATSTMSVSPSGTDSFVYPLTAGASVSFGALSVASVATAVAMSSVVSTIKQGYTVYVQANQPLQTSAGSRLASVSGAGVTAGVEGYGASVTGTRAINPDVDVAVTTTQRVIQSNAGSSGIIPERIAMTYKVAIALTTVAGNYSQSVFYTLTANY